MAEDIIHSADATFDRDVLKAEVPVLVDFWAPWCMPCQMIAPVLEKIAQTYKGKLRIVKVNVDDNMKTPAQYGVAAIPTLILFKGGELQEQVVGVLPAKQIEALLSKYL
jgi:thioredoxin 1